MNKTDAAESAKQWIDKGVLDHVWHKKRNLFAPLRRKLPLTIRNEHGVLMWTRVAFQAELELGVNDIMTQRDNTHPTKL